MIVLVAILVTPRADAQQVDHRLSAHRIDILLDALQSPVFSSREEATRELLQHSVEVASVLNANPAARTLTPEQQVRVLGVLEDAFAKTPRAGLGVSFARQNIAQGAMLASVLPTFPAVNTLQPEDIVIEVDNERLASIPNGAATQYLRRAIISRDPGDYLPMRILRGDEEFAVQVELGRYDELGDAAPLQKLELAAAWDYRMQLLQLQPAHREPKIDVVELGSRWSPDRLRMLRRPEAASILPGGRSAASNMRLLTQAALNTTPRTMRQQALMPLNGPRQDPDKPPQNRDVLMQQLAQMQQELVDLQVHLNDQTLSQVERQLTSRLIIQLQSRSRDVRGVLKELPE